MNIQALLTFLDRLVLLLLSIVLGYPVEKK